VEDGAGGGTVEGVAVLGLGDFLAVLVVEAGEVLVVDVLDVEPLDLEEAFELERVVLPPEGEGLLVVAGSQPRHSLEHPALHSAEEQVGVDVAVHLPLPQLLDLSPVLGSGRPDAVLDGLRGGGSTLWTLSSLALRMTMPVTFCSASMSK
jgi:hypothetical protein